ncbi:hypothetical protein [Paraburkholderia fungorum]|uniref:hypothetical protein n=1 Tax=Paraburkholderia fungorum TaxID=134537 RepID=UPI000FDB56CB|nr:hypothetical protein [Paraburkholderia fungorum]
MNTPPPLEPDPFAHTLAGVLVGKRIESDHRDRNALLARLRDEGRATQMAFYGTCAPAAHCVVETVADVDFGAVWSEHIIKRIVSLEHRRCGSLSADVARFDPSRLGGRGAAGRRRDRARAAEGRRLLAERIHRLTAEFERRGQFSATLLSHDIED